MEDVKILGADGFPIKSVPPKKLAGYPGGNWGGMGGTSPYVAGNLYSQRMADWLPFLGSPDTDLNMYRDRIVSRTRDLVRNDGWASGAITRTVDNCVGASFRAILNLIIGL